MFGCIADAAHRWQYSPDAARELLRPLGDAGKIAFGLFVDPALKAAGDAVVSDLATIGMTARMHTPDPAALRDSQADGHTPMVLLSANRDALADISETIGPAFLPGKLDYARDPELHDWLESALRTFDREQRMGLYGKAIARITEQVYWLPLFSFAVTYAFTDEVSFIPAVDGLARLYRVEWK
jgi:peptide/nickel transport system substrate-binding protein